MILADDAVQIYHALSNEGIRSWLTGGWGIDALLGVQTRPHKDLDILMLVDDVEPMRHLLAQVGYSLKELWSENAPAVDLRGTEVPTAFVLHDADNREIDAHALRFDTAGNAVPVWVDDWGLVFSPADLSGRGSIGGIPVACLSPAMQLRCHTGYELPEYQKRDLERLRDTFAAELGGQSS